MRNIIIRKSFNKYDYGIIILIGLLIFGGIGGAFQPVRIMGMVFSPYVYHHLFSGKVTKNQHRVFLFFLFWFLYAFLTFFWTPDRGEGAKVFIYFYTHFSLFFLLVIWSKKALDPLRSILYGWIMVLVLSLPVALYEVLTYQHLPISRYDEGRVKNLGGNIIKYRFASVTFMNSNTYVVFLAFCLPFLLGRMLMRYKKRSVRLFHFGVLVASSFILFINASRGGILCLSIYLVLFFFFALKHQSLSRKIKKFVLLSITFASMFVVLFSFSQEFFMNFMYRIGEGGASFTADNSRFQLYEMALTLLKNSLFFGTGVGSEQAAMATISRGITATHSLLFEVLMQYGVIVFTFFCGFLYKIFIKVRKVKVRSVKYILTTFLIAFAPLFIINSGYLLMPSLWLLFASLFVIGHEQKINFLNRS